MKKIYWDTEPIKYQMAQLGINASALAERVALARATVTKALNEGKGTNKTFHKLCLYLEIDPGEVCKRIK